MKNRFPTCVLALLVFASGCREDDPNKPFGGGAAPGDVTVTGTRAIPGGAVIRYAFPADDDLLYVKALFEQTPGHEREVRASYYVDSLLIEGLPDAAPKKVRLHAVSRSERLSPGVEIVVEPLTPPIVTVARSLSAAADFGGFALSFDNPDASPVFFNVYVDNAQTYESELHDVIFTERESGVVKVRGLASLPTDFAVYVTDRWGNVSEPYTFRMTPRLEYELDGREFAQLTIPGDVANWANYGGSWIHFWDNSFAVENFAHVKLPTEFPHSTTIDLKRSVLLSRMKIWQYSHKENECYAHGSPRLFQIWGCAEDADFMKPESYTLLLDAEVRKPSGGGFGDPNTEEDMQALLDGHEFEFDNPPVVRYVRFVALESWSGSKCTRVAEMRFWGAPLDGNQPQPNSKLR